MQKKLSLLDLHTRLEQLEQRVDALAGMAICLHCGEQFQVGRGRGKARRVDAKFCCDEHRRAYNSLKRSRADAE